MKVLVSDSVAREGIDILRQQATVDVKTGLAEDALVAIIGEYDALVVRSSTQVTKRIIEAGTQLQVIGRAGVGVDNIDVDAATQRGVLVVNAPDGNTLAAAEHTIAMMLAMARHIPQADASLRQQKWERNKFTGVQVTDKTLGVIGMGRIGTEVARRGRGLGMRVLACDPYTSSSWTQSIGVEMCSRLEDLLEQSDFVTVHVPLTAATRNLLGEQELALLKPGARVINCARGGVINEEALLKALDEGQLAGAALDVFSKEPATDNPLVSHPKTVVTPHLGASTAEAQVAVAVDVAHQIADVLSGRPAAHPVNAPLIPPETQAQLLPFCELAENLGRVAIQLMDHHLDQLRITYAGQLASMDTGLLSALLIKGLLQDATESRITQVNAGLVARARGLQIVEEKTADAGNYASLITLSFTDNGRDRVLSGTIMRQEPHIVQVDQYWLDFVPRGYQLVIDHLDQPGMIGQVGQVTGAADVNIAFMAVGRQQPRGDSLMVLTVDEYVTPEVRAQIAALPDVHSVRLLELPPRSDR
ncbi:MAG: phosphoglycerate dehydrogenase [Anaerolineales bacterium]|nr:phosphoglycerate dehydrogenase [Anaerolineales bacterium]